MAEFSSCDKDRGAEVTNRTEKTTCQPHHVPHWESPRAVVGAAQHHVTQEWMARQSFETKQPIPMVWCTAAWRKRASGWVRQWGAHISLSPQRPTTKTFSKLSRLCTHHHLLLLQHLPRLLNLTISGNSVSSGWAFMQRKGYSEVTLLF